jgi:hypothetical protein
MADGQRTDVRRQRSEEKFQVSAPPPAAEAASLIEKETLQFYTSYMV